MTVTLETRLLKEAPVSLAGRIIRYLLVFLTVFLLCEIGARFVVALQQPSQGLPESFQRKIELVRHKPATQSPLLLFMGNSLVYMGIYPELLEARLKDSGADAYALNLATPSGSPSTNLALLQKAVRSGMRPALVFYNLGPNFQRKRADFYILDRPFQQSYLYRCQLAQPQQWLTRVDCAFKKASYLYRYQDYLKSLIGTDLSAMLLNPDKAKRHETWIREDYVHQEISAKGWAPAYRVYSHADYLREVGEKSRMLFQQAGTAASEPDLVETPDFEPLTRFCEAHGIRLVLVDMPGFSFTDTTAERAAVQTRTHMIQRYLTRHPSLRYLDLSQDQNPGHFYDRGHQNASGAVALTTRIANILLAPPYRALLTTAH